MSFSSNNYYNSQNPFESSADSSIEKSILRKKMKVERKVAGTTTVVSGFNQYAKKSNNIVEGNTPPANPFMTIPADKVERNSVERVEDIQFVQPVKRVKPKAPAEINYLPKRREVSKTAKKFAFGDILIKLAWGFACILFLRLIFVDRGVIDYFSKENLIKAKQIQLQYLEKDNVELNEEIKKIKSDVTYQKKLARDHLGVIDDDEYLVLFAKER